MIHKRHYVLIVSIAIMALAILAYNYMRLDGVLFNPVIVYESNDPIPTMQPVYKPGEMVQGMTSYCKKRDIVGKKRWFLVDTYIKIFPSDEAGAPVGCQDNKIFDMAKVPPDTFPGVYHLEVDYAYDVNIFNTVHYHRKSVDFRVVR